MKLRKKLNKIIAVSITICMVVSMMPILNLTAEAATVGETSTDNSMNALSALGIDTSALPEGYNAVSEENPYGKEKATISPVSELFIESSGSTNRIGKLYGNNLPIGSQVKDAVGDFYTKDVISTAGSVTTYNAYRATSGDFTGDGLDGQVVTVAAKAQVDSKGGIDLYFTDPTGANTGTKSTKTILDSNLVIGNKADDLYPNENFVANSYQLQNYMQITTGDFNGNGIDDIAVYVPEQGKSRIEVYELNTTTSNENDKNRWLEADNWELEWTYSLQEAPYVSNMVSLTAGDMDGDGIDDLGITWGVYYGKAYKTKCQAVVLHGSGVVAFIWCKSRQCRGRNRIYPWMDLGDGKESQCDANRRIWYLWRTGHGSFLFGTNGDI